MSGWTAASLTAIATEWPWSYNHQRPNMGIGGVTPAQELRLAA
jgi:putative transposase